MLDELVSEGLAFCVVDEETGRYYYMAPTSFVGLMITGEAIASVLLDRDDEVGTYSIG